MELSRRDAVAALAALGAGGATVAGIDHYRSGDADDGNDDGGGRVGDDGDGAAAEIDRDRIREVMVAAAEVVYPSEVSGHREFVEGFLVGRLDRVDHAGGLEDTTAKLDDLAREWQGAPFADLAVEDRDRHLREVGADTAGEDPNGRTPERVRYYVVNELLLALYASPAGGELVGIENPQGHPGGTDTYQRGPDP